MAEDPRLAIMTRISKADLPPMTKEEAKEWIDTSLEKYRDNPKIPHPEEQVEARIFTLEDKFQRENNAVGLQNIELVKSLLEPSNTLTTFIKHSNNVIQGLSEFERDLLKLYTTSTGYIVLNTVLRGSVVPPTEDNKEFVEELLNIKEVGDTEYVDKDTAKSMGIVRSYVNKFLEMWKRVPPIQDEIHVYRGVQREQDILLHDNQFLSTSTDRSISRRYFTKEGCCLLHITIKPGVRALYIGDISTIKAQSELLIGPPFRAEIVKEGEEDLRGFKVKHMVISPVTPYRKSAGTRRRKSRKNGRRSLKRRTKH